MTRWSRQSRSNGIQTTSLTPNRYRCNPRKPKSSIATRLFTSTTCRSMAVPRRALTPRPSSASAVGKAKTTCLPRPPPSKKATKVQLHLARCHARSLSSAPRRSSRCTPAAAVTAAWRTSTEPCPSTRRLRAPSCRAEKKHTRKV